MEEEAKAHGMESLRVPPLLRVKPGGKHVSSSAGAGPRVKRCLGGVPVRHSRSWAKQKQARGPWANYTRAAVPCAGTLRILRHQEK